MKQDRFPLVSDDEIMLTKMPVMDLYDESDFISNIKGDYRDKNYLEWSPINEEETVVSPVVNKESKPSPEPLSKSSICNFCIPSLFSLLPNFSISPAFNT